MLVFAAEGGEHNPLFPIWQEIVVGAVAFTLLYYVLRKYVFPKMEQTFRERVDAIEGGLKRAQKAQAEADALLEQYRAQLAEARAEAGRIREEARVEGVRIVEEMRAEAQAQAQRIVERGEQQLRAERERLVVEMRTDLGRVAVDLASRIVGESLADEARRAATVERFLSELDAAPVAGRR